MAKIRSLVKATVLFLSLFLTTVAMAAVDAGDEPEGPDGGGDPPLLVA